FLFQPLPRKGDRYYPASFSPSASHRTGQSPCSLNPHDPFENSTPAWLSLKSIVPLNFARLLYAVTAPEALPPVPALFSDSHIPSDEFSFRTFAPAPD